ncbi:hypothetical protein OXPF_01560 [Oxobacter pfennigii]|uniref:Uncharacterized protein n=1 Tax=Oxobacter pfennigii TaxID=36849 RepID=A0A0P8WBZ3_9CLOT|nr:hypothetical protein [Oxobacter pfennigii]KPU46237.1 hypothetical protein OXPF_01560 [Oxobacter pfennigii]
MSKISELEDKMKACMAQAKECVDLSISIIQEDKEAKRYIYKHWSNFLYHFLDYIKLKEKESGQEILKGVFMTKLIKYFR